MTTVMVMASPVSTLALSCSACASIKSSTCSLSSSVAYRLSKWSPQTGSALFSPWTGLKHLGISITPKSLNRERRKRCKGRVIHASLFGVGAPEALVIGVVALLVFGPKGLAEVARNLGKTLRAFQPTIRELQEVSREFKSTLEREIGLDEMSPQNPYSTYKTNNTSTPPSAASTEDSKTSDPNGVSSSSSAYSSEDYLKITEEQLKASAALQQKQTSSPETSEPEPQIQPSGTAKEAATTKPSIQKDESGA